MPMDRNVRPIEYAIIGLLSFSNRYHLYCHFKIFCQKLLIIYILLLPAVTPYNNRQRMYIHHPTFISYLVLCYLIYLILCILILCSFLNAPFGCVQGSCCRVYPFFGFKQICNYFRYKYNNIFYKAQIYKNNESECFLKIFIKYSFNAVNFMLDKRVGFSYFYIRF